MRRRAGRGGLIYLSLHMKLAPREFAWSYIQRSGRIDPEKLRAIAPKFVAGA